MNNPFGYGPATARFVTRGTYSPPLGTPVPTEADKAAASRIISTRPAHWDPVRQAERVDAMARIISQRRREFDWKLTIALRVIQAFAIGSMSQQSQPMKKVA